MIVVSPYLRRGRGCGLPAPLSLSRRAGMTSLPAVTRSARAGRGRRRSVSRRGGGGEPGAAMAECSGLQFVSPYAFEAMQKVDVVRLAALSDPELRLLLPCLVRMALCAPADQSQSWAQDKKLILRLLSGVEAVNSIVALLSVDFHALEQDASKEQQLR